ncbi:MAG: acetylesterase [Clostridia bacterium]|nr:acetylesterase [Clostridia bacterium]
MAILQTTFLSVSLMRTVNIEVILPADKMQMDGTYMPAVPAYKTLYLLHGIFGSEKDWITRTNIVRYAEERNIAVIMPAGENAFYTDQPEMHALYSQMISKDLVDVTRRMFPLSHRREDTFIGGLSMGGYGALYNGLHHCDTFGRIIALSTADRTKAAIHMKDDSNILVSRSYFTRVLGGNLEGVEHSRYNIPTLAGLASKENDCLPMIYLACGTQDPLLETNRNIRDALTSNGYSVDYHETEGAHSWDFWDHHIHQALKWITDKSEASMHSGNVL